MTQHHYISVSKTQTRKVRKMRTIRVDGTRTKAAKQRTVNRRRERSFA